MMKYKLEKGLSLLLSPRRHHHHHSLFCAAAAIIVEASSRSRSAPVVAGTRRHKRALEASSAKIVCYKSKNDRGLQQASNLRRSDLESSSYTAELFDSVRSRGKMLFRRQLHLVT